MCNFVFGETLSGVKPTSSVSHQCGSAHSSRGLWLSAEEARVPPHRSECGFRNFSLVLCRLLMFICYAHLGFLTKHLL